MAALPLCISALISWAVSPRLRRSFEAAFDFEFISGSTTVGISPSGLASARDHLLQLSGVSEENEKMQEALNDLEDLTNKLSYRPPVHAECAIMLHDARSKAQAADFQYSNYIGVSKLSCVCCDSYIRNYNKVVGTAWTTRGCRKKLYSWGITAETDPSKSVEGEMVLDMVASDVAKIFKARCKDRFGDDFTSIAERSYYTGGSEVRRVGWREEEINPILKEYGIED